MSDAEQQGYGPWVYLLVDGVLRNWLVYAAFFALFWSAFGYMRFDDFILVVQEFKPCTPNAE